MAFRESEVDPASECRSDTTCSEAVGGEVNCNTSFLASLFKSRVERGRDKESSVLVRCIICLMEEGDSISIA